MVCRGADDPFGFLERSNPADRDATRGAVGEVYRRAVALSCGRRQPLLEIAASSQPLRGGWYESFGRGVGAAGHRGDASRPDRVCCRAASDAYWDFTVEPFPETLYDEDRFRLGYTWPKAVSRRFR
jgi:hypothetical protein